jgi:hypothetical protein
MRTWKLISLAAAVLGLSAPAFAQRYAQLTVHRPSLSSSLSSTLSPSLSPSLSIGHRDLSLDARIGNVGFSIGRTSSRRPSGYVTPRCDPPRRVYVPGHYETVEHQVWIPATRQRVWCEPVYETRYDSCGRAYTVLVRNGGYEWVTTPGHYEIQTARVWVTGRWEYRS